MRRDEASFLLDMLAAAAKAVTYATELTYSQFLDSALHQHAIFKVLEIVGEGASRISADTQKAHPEIPWARIVGLRNRLVHVYFDIDLEVVWRIVQEDLPVLISQLESLAPPEQE